MEKRGTERRCHLSMRVAGLLVLGALIACEGGDNDVDDTDDMTPGACVYFEGGSLVYCTETEAYLCESLDDGYAFYAESECAEQGAPVCCRDTIDHETYWPAGTSCSSLGQGNDVPC